MPLAPDTDLPRADLSNWRTRPFSRWAFRNVRELMPVADIANDPAHAVPFDADADAAPLDIDLAGLLEPTATDALVVLHKGRLVYEFNDAGMTPASPHILMSATKSVVGLVAGTLHGAGLLDVDVPVSAVVPELARTAYQGATVRQLLDMRTGVVMDDKAQDEYRRATGWEPVAPGAQPSDLRSFFAHTTAAHKPHDGPFSYVSANTDLLGLVMERVAGQPFAAIASERLWRPMGAQQPAFITVDAKGAARCTGGLCATARDLARVGWLVAQGGRNAAGEQVVPEAWTDDMWRNGDPEAWNRGEFADGFRGLRMRYRSGWYAIDNAPGMLFAMGIHGQNVFVDRRNELVVAKLSSQAQPIDTAAMGLTLRAVAAIRRAVAG